MNKKEIPKMSLEYLTKNKLWDSYFLAEKYPLRFNNNGEEFNKEV